MRLTHTSTVRLFRIALAIAVMLVGYLVWIGTASANQEEGAAPYAK